MKKVIRIIGEIVFILILVGCGVALVKPGASVFFSKIPVDFQVSDNENVYEAQLAVSDWFYDLDLILVRENSNLLSQVGSNELNPAHPGEYAVKRKSDGSVLIRMVPSEDIGTEVSSVTYQALIRTNFITSPWLKVFTAVLLLGLLLFLFSNFVEKERRQAFLRNPFKLGKINLKDWWKSRKKILGYTLTLGILAILAYVFLEWIFYITKPSFMDILSIWEKLSILIINGLTFSILPVAMICLIFILDLFFTCIHSSYNESVYQIPVALILACLGLILIDNFTYTVFAFGIVKTTIPLRVVYALVFLVGSVLLARDRFKTFRKKQNNPVKKSLRTTLWASFAFVGLITLILNYQPVQVSSVGDENSDGVSTPNIILLCDDGLSAAHMSVYGYERETTPFLEELADDSLLMLNNVTNANKSTGSDTALLTGKLPFDTRVLYPPNTLTGVDMYEHLPGVLKAKGYKTISMGTPYYVDVNAINFQNAFDEVNGQANHSTGLFESATSVGYGYEAYFFSTISNRIIERLGHIFLIKDMDDPYGIVTGTDHLNHNKILEEVKSELVETKQSNQPLFAHIHLVTTHGAIFENSVVKFSAGQTQDEKWMTDFYDDAILTFDMMVQDFVEFLKENGLYENTILVVYTDHASQWVAEEKIPLIIHFPQDQYAGVVSETTQNLDIATTLLDYMGIDEPIWMAGSSLLGELAQDRLIFSAVLDSEFIEGTEITEGASEPPFYQFPQLNVFQCQMVYEIDLKNLTLSVQTIEGYTDPCPESMLMSQAEIWSAAGQMLSELGYELPDEWPE